MRGFRRPRGAIIQREITYLTRAYPPRFVEIYRLTPLYELGQVIEDAGARAVVFRGQALYIPAGGVVELWGGGQVERTSPTLIVVGDRDIQQGDFVALKTGPESDASTERTYLVENPLNHHGAYVEVRLEQHRQSG